jgi:type VI secretion system protein ImpG
MHPRLLDYYSREYAHLREMGAEFAKLFPKVASRLTLDSAEAQIPDPYVERLLEGFSFLAARIQLKLDAEFPRFTRHLLEMAYPHYLAPTPAMVIARFAPNLTEGNLAAGFAIPRGTVLRGARPAGEDTACEFRTAHDVMLWPLELKEARYQLLAPDLPLARLPLPDPVRGVLRLRLAVTAGLTCDQLKLDRLALFLSGRDEQALRLYELLFSSALGVMVTPLQRPLPWFEFLPREAVLPLGFEQEQALIPYERRSFSGYRLLHEYFAFPERFRFMEVAGLDRALARHKGNELEIAILLARGESELEALVDREHFSLFCTPAINLFRRDCDRIHVTEQRAEHQVVVDRTHPMDFEVAQVRRLAGHGPGLAAEVEFAPFYASADTGAHQGRSGYFTVRREPRQLSADQKRFGGRTSYVGSEVFLSLVDPGQAPYPQELRQLDVEVLATNRDLPLLMPVGSERDFSLRISAPVEGIRCLRGPSKPVEALGDRDVAWRLISHLSLNYLSITEHDPEQGAAALRELLRLYAGLGTDLSRRQIDGVRNVSAAPCTRRMPGLGPIAFARGLRVDLTVDESAFAGVSAFLLGCVLERWFARHASLNTFTELALRSSTRGEIHRWPPRLGCRAIA